MTDEEILQLAKDKFTEAQEREQDTRDEGLEDLKFARLGEQWPEAIKKQRELDKLNPRPCLTENRMPAFIRQVVNDVRQNKPGIVVHPADDNADVETAEIYNGLIRNIQVTSDSDVATDTAAESAVSNGFGYFRINITDDGEELAFERVANPFSVYGDPESEAADSSDWNCALVVSTLSKDKFKAAYKDAEEVDWEADGYTGLPIDWMEGDRITIAEYWHREPVQIPTYTLSDGSTVEAGTFNPIEAMLKGLQVVSEGAIASHKVTQYILTGAEVLETNEWPGTYIPIVPVYGDEINVEGKRYFRSLINQAKDAQRRFNYWLTCGTEMIALAPKVPFIGKKGAFDDDPNWSTANSLNHPYLEYNGENPPQRQPFDGGPVAVIQAMLQAGDGMKAVLGIYDASLGNRSNETSGVAITARQREGDVSTFHFIDNLSRAIRHAGRILIDLIPKVYSRERVVRILGEDMKPKNVKIAPGAQQPEQQMGEEDESAAIERIYDLTAGKYDLVVKSGPSYTTLREETRGELVEMMRAAPESAPILGPMYLRNSDWPGADEAADKIEQGGVPPEVQKQIADLHQKLAVADTKAQELALENRKLDLEYRKLDVEEKKIQAKAFTDLAGQTATEPFRAVA